MAGSRQYIWKTKIAKVHENDSHVGTTDRNPDFVVSDQECLKLVRTPTEAILDVEIREIILSKKRTKRGVDGKVDMHLNCSDMRNAVFLFSTYRRDLNSQRFYLKLLV